MSSTAPIAAALSTPGTASTKDSLNSLPNKGSAFDPATGKFFEFTRFGPNEEKGTIQVVRYWPDPRCWVKRLRQTSEGSRQTKGWEGNKPQVQLEAIHDPGPKTLEESGRADARLKHNLNLALSRIPDQIRVAICRFQSTYHWALLNLLARAPRFVERIETQPLVVLVLAHANYFKIDSVKRPYRSARALQDRRAVDILRWLDWPKPKATLRMMARIEPAGIQLPDLYRLRKLVQRDERWLYHLPRLNKSSLLFLTFHRDHVCFRLIEQVALSKKDADHRALLGQFRRLRRWVEEGFEVRRLPKVRDAAHLQQLSIRLARQRVRDQHGYMSSGRRGPPSLVVPPSPFELSEVASGEGLLLTHLGSPDEIYDHAQTMKNCLAFAPSYLRAIAKGRGVAYNLRWENPSDKVKLEGTAYFTPSERGAWRLSEVALAGNERAPDWLTQKVWNWAAKHSPQPDPRLGEAPAEEECIPRDFDQLAIPF